MRGDKFDPHNPASLGFSAHAASSASSSSGAPMRAPPQMAGRGALAALVARRDCKHDVHGLPRVTRGCKGEALMPPPLARLPCAAMLHGSATTLQHTARSPPPPLHSPRRIAGYSGGARAAYGDYPNYPEGRPIFLPEAERFGNPPDLPSLLLQQRVIYISMPVRSRGGVCACAANAVAGRALCHADCRC
jgi:hypothetical protein